MTYESSLNITISIFIMNKSKKLVDFLHYEIFENLQSFGI